jgi:hypothetical protein
MQIPFPMFAHIVGDFVNVCDNKKLRGFRPLANYADRPSDRRFLAK